MNVKICPVCGAKLDELAIRLSQYGTVLCEGCGYEVIPLGTPQEVKDERTRGSNQV